MSLSRKNSRLITVNGEEFRWVFFENSGWNSVTVQSANGVGQKLVIQFAWEAKVGSKLPYQPITPQMVANAIDYCSCNGWKYDSPGPSFSCRFGNGTFSF